MPFQNREQAAHLLAQALKKYKDKNPLVLAIPRGAVPMARIIADVLHGDMDVVLVHKIGAPNQEELAIGSVAENGEVYLNDYAVIIQNFLILLMQLLDFLITLINIKQLSALKLLIIFSVYHLHSSLLKNSRSIPLHSLGFDFQLYCLTWIASLRSQ